VNVFNYRLFGTYDDKALEDWMNTTTTMEYY